MRLFRFISDREYNSLMTGEHIHSERDWSIDHDTNSKGICFFANNRTNNIDRIVETALDDWGFGGIVKDFAIIEVEVDKARKAWGFYSGGRRTEYNLTDYDLTAVKAIYIIPHETYKGLSGEIRTIRAWNGKATLVYSK